MIAAEIYADLAMINHGIIAHGVNCQGVMGAGVAKDLAEENPEMYRKYKSVCDGSLTPGKIWPFNSEKRGFLGEEGNLHIISMATQEFYGSKGRARLEWIEECVKKLELISYVKRSQTPIYIPRIGCGHGGLDWEHVSRIFEASPIKFIVCNQFRVILAGSREMYRPDLLEEAIRTAPFRNKITNIVTGRAHGADTLGASWALRNGMRERPFPADWDKGKSAGHQRNLEMSKNADALIVVRRENSRGSLNMIERAGDRFLEIHDIVHEDHVDFGTRKDDEYQTRREELIRADEDRARRLSRSL